MSAAAAIPLAPSCRTPLRPATNPAASGASSTWCASSSITARNSPPPFSSAPPADLAPVTLPFGTGDIGLILARITRGLLRASALEARVVELAGCPPGCATQAPARTGPTCTARAPAGSRQARRGGRPSPCPSAHAGADRRRGPPSAGRRGHCRYLPRSRHHAEPSAVAGTVPRRHAARRQPRRPVQGHLRQGVADPVAEADPPPRPPRYRRRQQPEPARPERGARQKRLLPAPQPVE